MHLDKQDHRPVTRATEDQVSRLGVAEAARQKALLRVIGENRATPERRRADRRASKPG